MTSACSLPTPDERKLWCSERGTSVAPPERSVALQMAPAPHASSSATSDQLPALPTPPTGPMDVEAAYAFLGVPLDERGSLEKLKMRFRKLCLAYHPDKNLGREKEAAAAFTGLHAAYHFLTTTNFDHKRWATSFVIPPLQSLEEVLMMALRGAEPRIFDNRQREDQSEDPWWTVFLCARHVVYFQNPGGARGSRILRRLAPCVSVVDTGPPSSLGESSASLWNARMSWSKTSGLAFWSAPGSGPRCCTVGIPIL